MKNTKRTIRALLILAVIATIFTAINVSAATGINRKKATVTVGKTVQLTVADSGKVSWESSKKTVATVTSKGKVTGKKAGTATITAKVGKKKYTCKVTVKKASSSSLNLKSNGTLALDNNTTGMTAEEVKVYRTIMAKKASFPEGMTWTNSNYYAWNGGLFRGGYGCAGIAFLMSDAAFGTVTAERHTNFDNVKVGDILRVDYDSHCVLVLKVVGDTFVVMEGNYNGCIHWGRTISRAEVKRSGSYVITRY